MSGCPVDIPNGAFLTRTLPTLCVGLLDEVSIDPVPLLLGSGVPSFVQLKAAPILLHGPSLVVEGERVTHLRYTIRRP